MTPEGPGIRDESAFEAAFESASRRKGWFSRGELRRLFGLALTVPEGRCIVEVGSYAGKSTAALAHAGRTVLAIDPLAPGTAPTGTWEVTDEHVASLEGVVAEFPNVRWLRMLSTDCPRPEEPIGLLHIDGHHDWPHPMEDFSHFEPWIAPGGVVAFHDFCVSAGVSRTVEELLAAGRIERLFKRERLFAATVCRGT